MFPSLRRTVVCLCRRAALLLSLPLVLCVSAHAVVVRGMVTTPLGIPLGNARVELIQGRKVAAFTFSLPDGTYELRSSSLGRFVLRGSAAPYNPGIGRPFYGARLSVVTRNIVLEPNTATAQLAVTSTGIPTPIRLLPSAVTLFPDSRLTTEFNLINVLRQSTSAVVVQTGQTGGPIALYVRGGSPFANAILLDGSPIADIGGRFDLSTLASTALTDLELYRGPNSALYGTGASASVLRMDTVRGDGPRPVLDYTGDGGNFHTFRNEAVLSGAHKKLDYLAAFARFDSSNDLPLDRFHSITSVANLGYSLFTNTQLRFTLRNADSSTGLPDAHDLYGVSASGRRANQDIYSGLTIENTFGNWHNLARYSIVRKREQLDQFTPTGEPVTTLKDGVPETIYYGEPVTLRGANGYSAAGQAAFLLPSDDQVSNRDQFAYQTDYLFPHRIAGLFSFQYENERGRLLTPVAAVPDAFPDQQAHRTNFLYTAQIQGDIRHRVFYSFGGAIEKNHLYGLAGTPRLGLSYAPVRPGRRVFHGTNLRFNLATGVREPDLEAQFTSLDTLLNETGNQSALAAFHVAPLSAERTRTLDLGIDQNILNQKLILKAGYFHNEFSHQIETVDANGLVQYFGISQAIATQLPAASLNSLAFRTQGFETELQFQPFRHLFLNGGYTYLASLVLQSFAGDAVAAANGVPTTNPNLPGIAIGALSPLVGSRPFRRPPQTGFFAVQFSTPRFSTALSGALASRSDDSTFQLNSDLHGGNTLLLPNRNLDFGYTKLDLNTVLSLSQHVSAFTQLDNLLGQQHIGPIGYPGLPFTIRAGLKIRIGGN